MYTDNTDSTIPNVSYSIENISSRIKVLEDTIIRLSTIYKALSSISLERNDIERQAKTFIQKRLEVLIEQWLKLQEKLQ